MSDGAMAMLFGLGAFVIGILIVGVAALIENMSEATATARPTMATLLCLVFGLALGLGGALSVIGGLLAVMAKAIF